MIKFRSIQRLIDTVAPQLQAVGVRMSEGERRNEQAVGFDYPELPGLYAHVFSYGQRPDRYGISLELPELDGAPVPVPTEAEDLTLAAVVEMLLIHFDVPVRI